MKTSSLIASSTFIVLAIFAGIANITCLAGETNEVRNHAMEFMRVNPKMAWGDATNFVIGDTGFSGLVPKTLKPLTTSLRAGIDARDGVIVLSGQPLKVQRPTDLYLFTDSIEVWIGIPPFNESVIASMTDSNGVPVPRTPKGLALGQPLTLKPETTWTRWGMNNRNPWVKVFSIASCQVMTVGTGLEKLTSSGYLVLDPAQYFSIENPGLYKLTVTLRLYVVETNTFLKPITLPPVSVDVRVDG